MKKTIFITGGLGFAGSHTAVALLQAGYEVIIADNLVNAQLFILDRIAEITGKHPVFYHADVCEKEPMRKIFNSHTVDAVIHFAAHKAVGESVINPLKYFHNNLYSLINLLEVMEEAGCANFVFSSSATVYGDPDELPVTENTPFKKALSAYGSSKQMGEEILEKACAAGKVKAIALRYFNPVGAHPSGLIGELPSGTPNNLVPFLTQTAAGIIHELVVYGHDYPTPDGTCLRDYIHVVDLANAHIKACEHLLNDENNQAFDVFNVGTGQPKSVLELIQTFEKINQLSLNYRLGNRRPGDAAGIYADVQKANEKLHWKAELDLDDMVRDAWQWQLKLSEK